MSTPNTPSATPIQQAGRSSRGVPQRTKRTFTMKDVKELAGTILALWLAGLLIGIFYYAQLAGHVG